MSSGNLKLLGLHSARPWINLDGIQNYYTKMCKALHIKYCLKRSVADGVSLDLVVLYEAGWGLGGGV